MNSLGDLMSMRNKRRNYCENEIIRRDLQIDQNTYHRNYD